MAAGTVSQVVLSADYAAVRVDGQVILHPYDPNFNVPAGRDDKRFPPQSQGGDKNVTWVSMTNDFLVYGTSRGFVHYFYIKQVGLVTCKNRIIIPLQVLVQLCISLSSPEPACACSGQT